MSVNYFTPTEDEILMAPIQLEFIQEWMRNNPHIHFDGEMTVIDFEHLFEEEMKRLMVSYLHPSIEPGAKILKPLYEPFGQPNFMPQISEAGLVNGKPFHPLPFIVGEPKESVSYSCRTIKKIGDHNYIMYNLEPPEEK